MSETAPINSEQEERIQEMEANDLAYDKMIEELEEALANRLNIDDVDKELFSVYEEEGGSETLLRLREIFDAAGVAVAALDKSDANERRSEQRKAFEQAADTIESMNNGLENMINLSDLLGATSLYMRSFDLTTKQKVFVSFLESVRAEIDPYPHGLSEEVKNAA
jgi:hypothetical protein